MCEASRMLDTSKYDMLGFMMMMAMMIMVGTLMIQNKIMMLIYYLNLRNSDI